jgi:hypothetical protein
MENMSETKDVKQEVKTAPAPVDPPKKADGRAKTSASNLAIGRLKVQQMKEERAKRIAEEERKRILAEEEAKKKK